MQENESKRNRALKRVTEERKQRETKEQDIRKLEIQLKEKMAEERMLKGEVERNRKYQEYLENVVQHVTKDFPEISDILNRYKTLKDVNVYLNEKQQSDEAMNENTQRDFVSYKKEKENEILNKNNEIAEMQVRLEHCQNRTMRLQNEMDLSNLEASDKALALGQILSSVTNILERCEETFRIRHNKPQIERTGDLTDSIPLVDKCARAQSKLDEIAMFMVDYRDIIVEFTQDASYRDFHGGKRAPITLQQSQQQSNAVTAQSSTNFASGDRDMAKPSVSSGAGATIPDTSRSRVDAKSADS